MGKDIIAIDNDSCLHLYQLKSLKGKNLSLSAWRSEIQPQIFDLIMGKAVHPSLPKDTSKVRHYLVLTGGLQEETSRAIEDMNATISSAFPERRLEVLVLGDLLAEFKKNLKGFGPNDPKSAKTYLEIFLSDGCGSFPLKLYCHLVEECFSFSERPSNSDFKEAAATVAVIAASSMSEFSSANNYWAEFQGWIAFTSSLIGAAKKHHIEERIIESELNSSLAAAYHALKSLALEALDRNDILEGDVIADTVIQKPKMTLICGLQSLLFIWSKSLGVSNDELEYDRIAEYVGRHSGFDLWGEAAFPQLFAIGLLFSRVGKPEKAQKLMQELLTIVIQRSKIGSETPLAPPYYLFEEIFPYLLGINIEPLEDKFDGSSYILQSLVYLLTEMGDRELLERFWSDITRVRLDEFVPEFEWQFYDWTAESGTTFSRTVAKTQSWAKLKDQTANLQAFPAFEQNRSFFYLAQWIVYPHRIAASNMMSLWKNLYCSE
ncbi:MAG: hypothetical protein NT027_04310 [Proteobacteria bacterium]|nr:hypothetical protein [Pseudomonadota bacterium]